MKTIKTVALTSVLVFGMTTSVFASWWNPFTWFQKKMAPAQQVQHVSSTNVTVNIEDNQKNEAINTTPKNKIPESWRTFENKQGGVSVSFPKDFKVNDGTEDFIYKSTADGYEIKNSEYFGYCDKKLPNKTSSTNFESCLKGHYYDFGITIQNQIVDKKLIDSWGAEVASSKEITLNNRKAWLITLCAANGCSVSVNVVNGDKTVSLGFYNKLVDESRPMLISELGEQILNTLSIR